MLSTQVDPQIWLPICGLVLAALILISVVLVQLAGRKVSWVFAMIVIVVFITLGVIPVSLKYRDFETEFKEKGVEIQKKDKEITRLKRHEVLNDYLRGGVRLRTGDWGGKFEADYVTSTLFLLSEPGTKAFPIDVFERLLRWRSGLATVDHSWKGIFGILSWFLPVLEKKDDPSALANSVNNFVDSPLCDVDLLKRTNHSRVLILGEPASGKTTMLKYLELVAARRALADDEAPIPVFLELGAVNELTAKSLREQVQNVSRNFRDRRIRVKDIPTKRKYLLLLDALDETHDMKQAARAVGALATEPNYASIIVTSRIRNYADLLHKQPDALRNKGFRTALLYGTGQAAVEKRIFSSSLTPENRLKLLQLLGNPEQRSVWLQFFRLPANFDLAAEFLLELDVFPPQQYNLINAFVRNRAGNMRLSNNDLSDVECALAAVATRLINTETAKRNRDFALGDVALALHDANTGLQADQQRLAALLRKANKMGVIHGGEGQTYSFRHLAFRDFYVATMINDADAVPIRELNWRHVMIFKVGSGDKVAQDLLKRVIAEAKSAREESLIRLAIECIENSPNPAEFEGRKSELRKLLASNA